VIGVVAGVLLTQGNGSTAIAAPDSVGVVDASSGKIAASVPVGSSPAGVAADSGAVWVANTDEGTGHGRCRPDYLNGTVTGPGALR
jgi:YVTN family beta-propeller protein